MSLSASCTDATSTPTEQPDAFLQAARGNPTDPVSKALILSFHIASTNFTQGPSRQHIARCLCVERCGLTCQSAWT